MPSYPLSTNVAAGDPNHHLLHNAERDDINDLNGRAGLVGTGSPEGVVTASVGTTYSDQAGTLGAFRWVKASGSGNTGWKVLYGDTGYVPIAQWDTSGVFSKGALGPDFAPRTGVAGNVSVRRTASACYLRWDNIQAAVALGANTGGHNIVPLATFNPTSAATGFGFDGATVPASLNSGLIGQVYTGSGFQLTLPATSGFAAGAIVTNSVGHVVTFPVATNAVWPTALP